MHKIIFSLGTAIALSLSPLFSHEVITLKDALERGLRHSFELQKAAIDVSLADTNAYQAYLLPNPQFSINGETASFMSHHQNTPSVSYGVAQLVENGRKRRARREVASAMQGFAEANYLQSKIEMGYSIKEAFTHAAVAKRYVEIALENKNLQEKILECLSEKAESGKISQSEKSKQSGNCHLYHLAYKRKLSNYENAKLELAFMLGMKETDFDVCDDSIYQVGFPELFVSDQENFLIKVKDWQVEMAQQQIVLAESKKIPDISVNAGFFHENKTQPSGLFFGISVELPVFNNHDATISRAYLEAEKQEISRLEFLKKLYLELKKKHLAIEQAYEEILYYQNCILQKAEESYQEMIDCQKDGKMDSCEIYKEKLSYLQNQEKYLEVLENYHISLLEFQKLTGRPVEI
ncbi:hypothetical protein PHSC3_000627 [Chlamydiales bacterium STE3]|nr:hypothetical protein PHSC3_000627 [Chlamydiales bacterium STE3]